MSPKLNTDAFLSRFDAMDERLVAKGFHRTSIWWRREFERFLRSGKRRWVIRAGRRAGKSSFLCRLAVAWALWGPWSVPAGDVAVIPFVSVDRDEAASRIRTVKDILAALEITADVRTDEIELKDRACIFRVETCSITSVGFTSIMVVADEMARWLSKDANPAKEVMGSIRPTMATQELAFEVCSSSPWGEDDYHAELFDQGESAHQCVSFAETWTANPTISEVRSHQLEPDDKIWSREYAAIPGGVVSQALDRDDVRAAHGHQPLGKPGTAFVCIDASKLRHDSFAWLSGVCSDAGVDILQVGAFEGKDFSAFKARGKLPTEHVVEQISGKARSLGVVSIFGDDYEDSGLRPLFRQQGVELVTWHWSVPSKERAFSLLRRLLKDGRFAMVHHQRLFEQMVKCRAHLLPGGSTSYATNGLDHLSCVIALMHAINDSKISLAAIATPAPPPSPYIGPSYEDSPGDYDEYGESEDFSSWYARVRPNRAQP